MKATSLLVLVGLLLLMVPSSVTSISCGGSLASGGYTRCCKYCVKGKACGNSCISRWKTCHKGRGCACNVDIDVRPAALIGPAFPI